MLETPSRSLLRHCSGLRKYIYQYGLSVTLLAKVVHGRNLLTVYVRVQWVVSWKLFGSFMPHFSNNNFSRVNIYWLVLPWDHDQSTVSVLAGYGRGHVCNLGRTLTKYSRKDKSVSQRYECIMVTSSNGNIFSVTGLLWGNTPVSGGFPSRRPVTPSFGVLLDLCH